MVHSSNLWNAYNTTKMTSQVILAWLSKCHKTFNKTNKYAQEQTIRVLNSSNLADQMHLALVNID
jgi:hypothetical protein